MLINGLYVFPLSKMDVTMYGYFMDKDGNIFSTKSGMLKRMSGSRVPGGHYFTLNKRTYRQSFLISMARNNDHFALETRSPKAAAPDVVKSVVIQGGRSTMEGLPGRSKSAASAISARGWMLATVGPSDRLVFSTDAVFHLMETTANDEAVRIATLKPGTEVVIMRVIKSVVAGGVTWK
jgi:hypothetical protein